ncbi:TPA: DUF262 domain-containing protein [Streptococcus suis]|uniref:DUF262 domain-containing protein n=1 Tax=Streptococcus suis TaxID=1307 RepID=UPI002AAE0CB8|nr:DUF262 domain-containing protein [Streptococcus suis]HEM5099379.1 DUF262 domain-containing protein [Streptococcus suis]HEM5108055.1 DUF262 domain-containing protein [Streptococcus suis]HEM5114178.1 DUF262 domain-containing protein [Streptococcus suis]HEM5126473.1 DUF262 domain-containing protein [Streptococcus suis]
MEITVAQECTVENLFSAFLHSEGRPFQFSIPLYQREYAWREQQWKELLTDLQHSFEKEGMVSDYWGNVIVFKDESKKVYEIVDGQQRLITLLLIISALDNVNKINGYFPLKFESDLDTQWANTLENSPDTPSSVFSKAKEYILKYTTENRISKRLLLEHLKKTKLSVVIVDDELESNLLFGRLNTRGLPLNEIDLIKHKLFYDTERNLPPMGDDIVLKKWKDLQKYSDHLKTTVEVIISNWLWCKLGARPHELYEKFLEIEKEDYLNFLNNLVVTVGHLMSMCDKAFDAHERVGRNLDWVLKLTNSEHIWATILGIENAENMSSRNKAHLYELITMIEFMRKLFRENLFEAVDTAYLEFGRKLSENPLEREIWHEIVNFKETLKETLVNEGDFLEEFIKLKYTRIKWNDVENTNLLSRYALFTLNNWKDENNHAPQLKYRIVDDINYSLEHIRPHSLGNKDDSNSPEFSIGNVVVLEKSINHDLDDKPVADKISKYKNSSYPQMKETLYKKYRTYSNGKRENNLLEWDVIKFDSSDADLEIIKRGRYLATVFYDKMADMLNIK